MSVSPAISIITPSYNQGAYLEQTIDSVLSQNYPALQYMIIDGGSTDNSVDIIRKYEKYLYRWVSEKDAGQSDAINKGFLLSTGDVFNVLNSDDWYATNTLHRIGDLFRQAEVHVVCGRSRILFNGKEIRQNKGTDLYPGNLEKTIGCARIDQPETFFRRTTLAQAGLLNPQLHYIWDKDWWMRYLLCFGLDHIISVPDLLVNFRLHEESKTFNYLEDFNRENFDLFYSIARDKAPAWAESLQQFMHPRQLSGLQYNTLPVLPAIDYNKILNYFIWERIQLAYAQNRFVEAKNLMGLLDEKLLSPEERNIIHTIRSRLKILPVWFKKILNSLR